MPFEESLSGLRKIGRKLVLPSDQIKSFVKDVIPSVQGSIIDLGAGTLYWSEWLNQSYDVPVYAVDVYYDGNGIPANGNDSATANQLPRIMLYKDFDACPKDNIGMLWMCDAFHHFNDGFRNTVMKSIEKNRFEHIVIKDIDCRRSFGNRMNRLHDRVINHEIIHDVDPQDLERIFSDLGYIVHYEYIPKLWYPHFLIVASR